MSLSRRISVIICTFTEARWDDLVQAVASVKNQTAPPHEIIVVVDHNRALFERARACWSDVRVIENAHPAGASGARNSAVAVAAGEVVVFMDDDALADPAWLEQLAAPYDDPRVVGVGGGVNPLWLAPKPAWFPPEFNWVVGCTHNGMPSSPEPVRNLICANMSVRRDLFLEAGGFRDDFGHLNGIPYGCEETELCIRIGQRWRDKYWLYVPEAAVRHKVPALRGRWAYFRARCYLEGRSKAMVSRFAGMQDGLSSERAYTRRTLPRGVVRGLRDTLQGDLSGLQRAAAIVIGLAITAASYTFSRAANRHERPSLAFRRVTHPEQPG